MPFLMKNDASHTLEPMPIDACLSAFAVDITSPAWLFWTLGIVCAP
jgi:hypothetical protein